MPDDLTPEEQQELENIRRRKQELLQDIQVMAENVSNLEEKQPRTENIRDGLVN